MPNRVPVNFAARLKNSREKFNLGRDELARIVHVTANTIQRWEAGNIPPTGENKKRVLLWVTLTEDPSMEQVILKMIEDGDLLALGGFFGMLAGIHGVLGMLGPGVLKELLKPDSSLMRAITTFSQQ